LLVRLVDWDLHGDADIEVVKRGIDLSYGLPKLVGDGIEASSA